MTLVKQNISALPVASAVASADLIPVVQGSSGANTGTARQATVSELLTGVLPANFSTLTVSGAAPHVSVSNVTGYTGEQLGMFHSANYSTTIAPVTNVQQYLAGSITSGTAFYNTWSVVQDGLDLTTGSGPGGAAGWTFNHFVTAGAKGSRSGHSANLYVTGANTQRATDYLVAADWAASATASAGGAAGANNQRGNLFGGNIVTSLKAGAGAYWNSITGLEINFSTAATTAAAFKVGLQVVLQDTDAVAGTAGNDTGYVLGTQYGASIARLNVGFCFGHPNAWWPIAAAGTMIGTLPAANVSGPAYGAAYGVDFSGVTFTTGFLKSAGFLVDGSGNTTVAKVGFNGTAPVTKPTVTGSRGGNAALASLLTALASYGLITDSSS